MNGTQPQHIITQNDHLDVDPTPDHWLANAMDFETSMFDPGKPNFHGLPSCGHESVNYSTYLYGPEAYRSEASYQQIASSQGLPDEFEINRERHETLQVSNYSLECGPDGCSMSCPRTLPNIHLDRTLPKGPFDAEDAFPPSYYELDSQDAALPHSLAGQQSPQAVQSLKRCFSEQEQPTARFPSESPLSSVAHSQHGTKETNVQGPIASELDDGFIASRELTPESEIKEEPYAKRIYRCLINAPEHTMVLRDIYDWFVQNTEKGKEPDTPAWKNSIRHNLSMNAAFVKVNQPQGEEQKKGCSWMLADFAVKEGVKSTTRYRTKAPSKRSARTRDPDQKRMEAGAKGGQASKKAAQRRSQRLRDSSQLSTTAIRQLTNPRPPPVYDVPLLGFDRRAERQTSPYFIPHQGPTSYGQQLYGQSLPTSAAQFNPMRHMHGSPMSSTSRVHHNHLPTMAQIGQPLTSPDDPFFYDSPTESGDEPITPSSFDIGRMLDPFWGSQGNVDHQTNSEIEYGSTRNTYSA